MAGNPISTEEMDALMEAVQSAEAGRASGREPEVKLYDFIHPNKFSKEQLRALEMIYASCGRGLTTQLSALLRSHVDAELSAISETTYKEFFNAVREQAAIALLGIDPLVGRALLGIDPEISFAMVDRLLGGPGRVFGPVRELTEIERGLMGRVIERCIGDAWNTVVNMRPELEMIIGSTLFSQVALPDDRIVLATFTLQFGTSTGNLQFGIPITALDPVLSKLNAQQWFAAGRRSKNETTTSAIRQSLDRTVIDLTVELGRTEVSMRDLLDLQVGDLIRLESKASEDLELLVGSQVKFRGQPGCVGRRLGFRITEKIEEDS
jgi:flagellar motor switch protein FliM